MLPLRHARLWRVLSILIVASVLLAALAPLHWLFENDQGSLSWLPFADKWMHAATFAFLMLWFSGLFQKHGYWRIAAALLLFGVFVELCQLQVSYRTAEWNDMLANTAGIIVGLAVAVAGLGGWGLRIEDWYTNRHP